MTRHRSLPPRRVFALHLLRNLLYVSGLIAASLAPSGMRKSDSVKVPLASSRSRRRTYLPIGKRWCDGSGSTKTSE